MAGEGSKKKSLVIPLKEDGTADYESMRDATAEKLRRAVGTTAPGVTLMSADDTGWLIDGIASLEAFAVVKFFKIDADLVASVMPYSREEKVALGKPMAAIINKYGGRALKYRDEAELAFTLYGIFSAKVAQLGQMQHARNEAAVAAEMNTRRQPSEGTNPI